MQPMSDLDTDPTKVEVIYQYYSNMQTLPTIDTMPTKTEVCMPTELQHTANIEFRYSANIIAAQKANTNPAFCKCQIWTQCQQRFGSLYQYHSNIQPILIFDTMPTKIKVIEPLQLQHTANDRFGHNTHISSGHYTSTGRIYSQY